MTTIIVKLGVRTYPIHIEHGLIAKAAAVRAEIRGKQVMIISNETVAPLYLGNLYKAFSGLQIACFLLADGESHKTFSNVECVLSELAAMGANRDATVVALGGGVVGDLAGLSAALWMRGVTFLQVPTTLLAMVDSSVGGKTGVNLAHGKNLIGAFHQPCAVLIDPEVLATLPDRELRAGLAEVVKYAAIRDADFFSWLEDNAEALLAKRPDTLQFAIETSVRHKADVVAADEYEHGERALLNFGHTFGHAIESATQYLQFLHGETVAIGMHAAALLAAKIGMSKLEDAQRLQKLLIRLGLPTQMPADLNADRLLALMRLDKKNLSGSMRLILWRGVGNAEIVSNVGEAEILSTLSEQ